MVPQKNDPMDHWSVTKTCMRGFNYSIHHSAISWSTPVNSLPTMKSSRHVLRGVLFIIERTGWLNISLIIVNNIYCHLLQDEFMMAHKRIWITNHSSTFFSLIHMAYQFTSSFPSVYLFTPFFLRNFTTDRFRQTGIHNMSECTIPPS